MYATTGSNIGRVVLSHIHFIPYFMWWNGSTTLSCPVLNYSVMIYAIVCRKVLDVKVMTALPI